MSGGGPSLSISGGGPSLSTSDGGPSESSSSSSSSAAAVAAAGSLTCSRSLLLLLPGSSSSATSAGMPSLSSSLPSTSGGRSSSSSSSDAADDGSSSTTRGWRLCVATEGVDDGNGVSLGHGLDVASGAAQRCMIFRAPHAACCLLHVAAPALRRSAADQRRRAARARSADPAAASAALSSCPSVPINLQSLQLSLMPIQAWASMWSCCAVRPCQGERATLIKTHSHSGTCSIQERNPHVPPTSLKGLTRPSLRLCRLSTGAVQAL